MRMKTEPAIAATETEVRAPVLPPKKLTPMASIPAVSGPTTGIHA